MLKTLLLLIAFSTAMGFMESAVVVYLRTIYYPDGFIFPLVPLDNRILLTELLREAATLIMLLTTGIMAGKNFAQRFVFFLFCFAIWDISYYIFLWALIGWPASLLDWDILFLLPVPWIGPVLAPCLFSVTMIMYTLLVIYLQEKQIKVSIRRIDWILMTVASLIIIGSFTSDYFQILFTENILQDSSAMQEKFRQYIPDKYNWVLFVIVEIILLADLALIFSRNRKSKISTQ